MQALAPLFQPVVDVWYRQQMGERVFHKDETRWEVFEAIDGKIGSRWYLWVTRSASVIYFCIDPSRSAAVPGAHFAGLRQDQLIIVCDRYSAYKKLAFLAGSILLAFCWAHVRCDFLDAGRALAELGFWALDWKARIGQLYHLNLQRLALWQQERPLSEQSAAFGQALQAALDNLHDEAARTLQDDVDEGKDRKQETNAPAVPLSKSARSRQRKIYRSLIEHWPGLIRIVDHCRAELSRLICEALHGYKADGGLKAMSARVAMALLSEVEGLRMQDDGLITLPPSRGPRPDPSVRLSDRSVPGRPILQPAGALVPLALVQVEHKADSSLWNEFMQRYHYLGHKPLSDAQSPSGNLACKIDIFNS